MPSPNLCSSIFLNQYRLPRLTLAISRIRDWQMLRHTRAPLVESNVFNEEVEGKIRGQETRGYRQHEDRLSENWRFLPYLSC